MMIRILAFTLPAALLAAPPPTAVAMVADLQGHGSIRNGTAEENLVLTAEVAAGPRIQLDAGARLVLLSFSTGELITLSGPVTATLDANGRPVGMGKGAHVSRVKAPQLKEVLKPGGLAQASLVMRDPRPGELNLTEPRDRVLTNPRPHFTWTDLGKDVHYAFQLSAQRPEALVSARCDAPELTLPEKVALEAGVNYTWRIEATLPGGGRKEASGTVALLSRVARGRLERIKARKRTAFAMGIAYASALQEAGLATEARAEWKALLEQRPGDPVLAGFAR